MVLFENLVVCFRQLIVGTGSGYLKEDTFTLPKGINTSCMSASVTKLNVGTSPALDRATTYYKILGNNKITIGIEDGDAGLTVEESQLVSVIVMGFEG